MPLDVTPLALPSYEQAYVTELFNQLVPGATAAQNNYILTRTRASWQTHMQGLVYGTAVADPLLPAYEQAYVVEWYNYLLPFARIEFTTWITDRTPAPWQEQMTTYLTGYATVDTDAGTYFTQVVADGGVVTDARKGIISQFVKAEKAAGTWALTDDYWVLWGENSAQALRSLKQKRLIALIAAPAFTVNRGYTFNGTTQALNTGFIPGTHGTLQTINSARLAAYEVVDAVSAGITIGAFTASNQVYRIRNRTTGSSAQVEINALGGGGAIFSLPSPTSVGLFSGARTGATGTDSVAYKNGVALTRTTAWSNIATLATTHALYIGGLNNAGTLSNARPCSVGFGCVGAVLTPAQELAQYNNIQAMANAVGVA